MLLKGNDTVLFQGDSITDAKRARQGNDDLGNGYVSMIASLLTAMYPELNLNFVNRGCSGDKVVNLKARWQEDCLDLKPDVLSIMIGINDCWSRYSRGELTTAESFYQDYRRILTAARDAFNPRLVLCEPFLMPCPEDRRLWREDLDDKITAVRDLAREFKALLVPLDGIFAAASTQKEPEHWAADGVHPTPFGNALITRAWLAAVKASV